MVLLDESGSDSERGGSGESTSSYSSLSDFVSELASSDLSPLGPSSVAHRMKSYQDSSYADGSYGGGEEYVQREYSAKDYDRSDRNVTSLCSGLDSSTVYNPPSSLQYPGDFARQRKGSDSGSGSGSGSESSASSGAEEMSGESRRASVETRGSESRKGSDVMSLPSTGASHQATATSQPQAQAGQSMQSITTISEPSGSAGDNTSTAASTPSTGSQHQLTSSISSIAVASAAGGLTHKEPKRQSSFGSSSLFGNLATQAKELVKETKRQSSQEGLLSQVDKVSGILDIILFFFDFLVLACFCCILA